MSDKMNKDEARSEFRWVLWWAVGIVILASLPYFWGILVTPPGYHFLGLTHNIDDAAVYLSWMRQVADGHVLFRNLFTNEPTSAGQFNVLFLLMGGVAAVTHLPLIWVFHLFRVCLGVALILAIWQFSKLFLESADQRRLLIPLVGLTAGIGWLIPGAKAPTGPVDVWQPEAITFLSIYLNPLFLAGLILMVGSFYCLVLAQRTGETRHAVCAGLCLLLLGNVHTYDVLTVGIVWACCLLVECFAKRAFPARALALSALAALIALPSIAYQFHLYRIDEVFRARANSPAPSPAIWSLFAGYGLVLAGAIAGAAMSIVPGRRTNSLNAQRSTAHSPLSTLHSPLLLIWAIVGFAIPYLPVAQQRKLVMGLHIPLCILCAYALSHLLTRFPRPVGRGLVLAFILFGTGSNVGFLAQDINLLSIGRTVTIYTLFMSSPALDAMRWLRENTRASDAVFAPPTFALFTPALAGRPVYYGHWSETPDYPDKLREWAALVDPSVPEETETSIILRSRAEYYVVAGETWRPSGEVRGVLEMPPAFTGDDVSVYRVRPNAPRTGEGCQSAPSPRRGEGWGEGGTCRSSTLLRGI